MIAIKKKVATKSVYAKIMSLEDRVTIISKQIRAECGPQKVSKLLWAVAPFISWIRKSYKN